MKQLFLSLSIVLIVLACEKATPFTIDVSRITPTDSIGVITGTVDNSDWAFDKEWSETEKAFFRTDPVDMSSASVATISLQPAYANPTVKKGNAPAFSSNKNYRIYYSFDAPASSMYYKGHGDVTVKD